MNNIYIHTQKLTLETITHLKSCMLRKLLPTPPNEFPKTKPVQTINFIRAPTLRTTIF
jgi:hypothetical protein